MGRGQTAWGIFAGVAVVYAVTAFVGAHQSTDTVASFGSAWQLAHHGNLWMDHVPGERPWQVVAHGHSVSARFPGVIFLAAPFYAVFSLGSSAPTVGPSLVVAVLCSAAAIAVMFLCLDRVASRRQAVGGALLGAFGTTTWNVSSTALWTHGPAQLALALAVLALIARRPGRAGAALGAAAVIRPPLIVVAVALAVAATLRARSWRPAVRMLPGVATATAALLAYNAVVFGHFGLDSGYRESGARQLASGPLNLVGNLPGTFFSPARGLFVLSPFLLVLGLVAYSGWRRASDAARDSAVAGVVYLLVELWLLPFTGADGFYGYRLPLETLILCAPLLAFAYQAWATSRKRRLIFVGSAALSLAFEAAAAFLRHPPLIVGDAWATFMPWTAVTLSPAVAVTAMAVVVAAVAAWVSMPRWPSRLSSVRSYSYDEA